MAKSTVPLPHVRLSWPGTLTQRVQAYASLPGRLSRYKATASVADLLDAYWISAVPKHANRTGHDPFPMRLACEASFVVQRT